MPSVYFDLIRETTTTTGTGPVTLGGAPAGFFPFSTIGDGSQCYYRIDDGGANVEIGQGIYTLAGTTLSRPTILASTNGGAAVNFPAGTKNVRLIAPADFYSHAARIDVANTFTKPQIVQAAAVTDIVQIFKGAASQSGDLIRNEDSTGAVLSSINSAGAFLAPQINGLTFTGNTNQSIGVSSNIIQVKLGGAAGAVTLANGALVIGAWNNGTVATVGVAGGGSGNSNRAGSHIGLLGGPGTGNGTPSRVHLQSDACGGASGTASNATIDRLIAGAFKALSNNTVTSLANCTLASGSIVAGRLTYAIEVTDGTDFQVEEGTISFHVTNKAGTIANNVTLKAGNQQAMTSGTLTVTFTITAANPAVIQVNANSSLTPSAGYPRITYQLENLTQQAVAIQ